MTGYWVARCCAYYGSVAIAPHVDSVGLPHAFAEQLRGAGASSVKINGSRVLFEGGVFRAVGRWNLLIPFGSGEVAVDAAGHRVVYRLRFTQLLVVTFVLLALVGLPAFAEYGSKSLLPLSLCWALIIVGNLLFGLVAFREFVKQTIIEK